MRKKILRIFEKNTTKSFLKLALLSTFLISGIYLSRVQGQMDRVSILGAGTNTCFQRVFQTYTAYLIQSTRSQYLDPQFLSSTEECFSEATFQTEKLKDIGEMKDAYKSMNNLASDTHWFHVELMQQSAQSRLESGVIIGDFGQRFSRLETLKNNYFSYLEKTTESLRSFSSSLKTLLVICAIFLLTLSLSEIVLKIKSRKRKNKFEREAELLAGHEQLANANNISHFLFRCLKEARLDKCAELFNKYSLSYIQAQREQQDLQDESDSLNEIEATKSTRLQFGTKFNQAIPKEDISNFHYKKAMFSDSVGKIKNLPKLTHLASEESKIDEIWRSWNDDEAVHENGHDGGAERQDSGVNQEEVRTHLDHSLANLIDRFSETIFSLSIKMDLDIKEECYVRAEREAVETILFYFMSGLVERLKNSDQTHPSFFKLSLKVNGPLTVLELIDSGVRISDKIKNNFETLTEELPNMNQVNELDMSICKELMALNGITMRFALDKSENNVTKVFFKTAKDIKEIPVPSTRQVTKGSKKELMGLLKESFSET